jgi:hypothetical protein
MEIRRRTSLCNQQTRLRRRPAICIKHTSFILNEAFPANGGVSQEVLLSQPAGERLLGI